MASNLPPGVSDSMIPGNRPEDILWERVTELCGNLLDELGFDIDKEDAYDAATFDLATEVLRVFHQHRAEVEVEVEGISKDARA